MDGKRKVGRQRIPAEFLKREESLKKAALGTKAEDPADKVTKVAVGSQKINVNDLVDLRSVAEND